MATTAFDTIDIGFDPSAAMQLLEHAYRPRGALSPDHLVGRLTASDIDGVNNNHNVKNRFKEAIDKLNQFISFSSENNINEGQGNDAVALRDRILLELRQRGIGSYDELQLVDRDVIDQEDAKIQYAREVTDIADKWIEQSTFDSLASKAGVGNPYEFRKQIGEYKQSRDDGEASAQNPLATPPFDNGFIKAIDSVAGSIATDYAKMKFLADKYPDEPLFSDNLRKLEQVSQRLNEYRTAFTGANADSAKERLVDELSSGGGTDRAVDKSSQALIVNLSDEFQKEGAIQDKSALKRLEFLGVSNKEIIALASGKPLSAERIAEISARMSEIEKAVQNPYVKERFLEEAKRIETLFGAFFQKNSPAEIQKSLTEQSRNITQEMKRDLHAMARNFENAYSPIGDSKDGKVEEKPYAAQLLVGVKRAENDQDRHVGPDLYDGYINLFSSDLFQELISSNLIDPSTDLHLLKRLDDISGVTVLADDKILIPQLEKVEEKVFAEFPTADDAKLSKEELEIRATERTGKYHNELDCISPFNVVDFSGIPDYHKPASDTDYATRTANLVALLKSQKRVLDMGDLADKNDVKEYEAKHQRRTIMLREYYGLEQDAKVQNIVGGGLDELIKRERDNLKVRHKELSTGYARFKARLESVGYKANAILNVGLWGVYRATGRVGVTGFLLGAALCTLTAPPMVLPMLCGALIMYFPSWVIKPALQASSDISGEGMNHEMELLNIQIESQKLLLTEAVESPDKLLSKYIIIAEELIDKFEPSNLRKREHIRTYFRKILGAYGVLELTGENRGIVREDVKFKIAFANINTIIIKGWGGVPLERHKEVEHAIKKSGFDGLFGDAAWKAFQSEYGAPNDPKFQNVKNLPVPEGLGWPLDYILRSTIEEADTTISDLAEPEANWFGEDVLKIVGYLHRLRIQPDVTAMMTTLNKIATDIQQKLPSKFGDKAGRMSQITRKQNIFNAMMYQMSTLKLTPAGGAGGGRKPGR